MMLGSVGFLLSLSVALLRSAALAANEKTCSVKPFAAPLRNCTFDTGVTSWGILVEAGTPGQRLCLVPSTVVNSTLVSQQSLCDVSDPSMSKLECESLRGGFFNENQSSTWTGVSKDDFNGTRSNPTWAHFNPPGVTKVGYDSLTFPLRKGSKELTGYGLALNEMGNNSNAGMLGLGVDSSFLDTAVKKDLTPSRSWSLDAGSQSQRKPRKGEIVFGGYNRGRIDGSFKWKNVSDMSGDRPCPLRTTITDMYITLQNGTQVPLKSSSEQIAACIEPYDNIFRFTPGMLLIWKQITGFDDELLSVYSPDNRQNLSFTEYGLPYNDSKVFSWSLTVSLDNGYTTTLPPYELQAPLRGWNRRGERKVVPGLDTVAILKEPTSEGEIPTLGKVFLSQSYLAVDYEKGRFGLAKATTEKAQSKLVPFGCPQNPGSRGGGSDSDSTPIGAIVGPAVGGGLVLVGIVGAVIFFLRRRKKRNDELVEVRAGTDTIEAARPIESMSHANSHTTYPSTSEDWSDRHKKPYVAGHPLPSPSEVTATQRVMQWEAGSQYSRPGSSPPPPLFVERAELHGSAELHEMEHASTSPPAKGVASSGAGSGCEQVHELSGHPDRKQSRIHFSPRF